MKLFAKKERHTHYYLKIGQIGDHDIFIKDAKIEVDGRGRQTGTTNLCEAKAFRQIEYLEEFAKQNLFNGYEIVKKKSWLYVKN